MIRVDGMSNQMVTLLCK